MSQIALPLDWPDPTAADIILSDANAHVALHFERWTTWPVMATLLTGPRKSGRSRFAAQFALRTGGRLFDNAEAQPEEALFHAWNSAQEKRRPLVIVADRPPPAWIIRLPDLASRIAATPAVEIGNPDDALIARLIEDQLGRRGLAVAPDLLAFLLARVERDYVAVHRVIDALDQEAFSRRTRLSVPLARTALAGIGMIDPVT
ncbi:HdaA/DnaA family protein [Sphingomonas sanxanigenens]|uniref:Hda lid domain-containing protein n=1 Tax=Sphingomonas sanxanigenens DSM 19645 = NX02 TaxID=1123269 RepID=W0AEH6_9SPHN|nr:DnaA/Hda family protein [Sphingomonas sanxanigenens]AHE54055.1 hypothetical protein NX02_11730 [Sphingomonas sanxanigenens DSM 19645 = NX02]